eukprot:gene11889-27516_t
MLARSFSNVKTLDISKCSIGSVGGAALFEQLADINMEALDVSLNGLGPEQEAIRMLGRTLPSTHLVSLLIGNNVLGEFGGRCLAAGLSSRECKMRVLDIGYNAIGSGGAKAIGAMLRTNRTLRELNMWQNAIGAEGAAGMAEGLAQNVTLRKINLGMNQLGDAGFASITTALAKNTAIEDIGLGLNDVTRVGVRALVKMWPSNTTITTLHLNNNKLGSAGIAELCKGMIRGSHLQSLHVDCNELGDKGAIQTLTMQQNAIGDKGAAMLATTVRSSRLVNLDLASNEISESGAKALAKCIELTPTLAKLSVFGNGLGRDGIRAISEAHARRGAKAALPR